jgi:hypothetical protein
MRSYACWSRDAVHWSNPAMMADREVDYYDLIQDDRGRFDWVDSSVWGGTDTKTTILVSRDLYHWEQLAQWSMNCPADEIRIQQRHDGSYQIFWTENKTAEDGWDYSYVYCRASKDGRTWTEPQELTRHQHTTAPSISAMEIEGRTLLGLLWRDRWDAEIPVMQLLRENGDGTWQPSTTVHSIGSDYGSMAWHPRWGYLLLWTELPDYATDIWNEQGPFIIRGPSVDAFFPKPK